MNAARNRPSRPFRLIQTTWAVGEPVGDTTLARAQAELEPEEAKMNHCAMTPDEGVRQLAKIVERIVGERGWPRDDEEVEAVLTRVRHIREMVQPAETR